MKHTILLAAGLLAALHSVFAAAPYPSWQQMGSVFILTTPEGADLPPSAAVHDFPLLVRLHRDSFDFSKAQPHGEDLRFATSDGVPLPYQVEAWDAARGEAAVWVRVPLIRGAARQELRVFWGKADATSESSGAAVFGESNGYLSVWHLGDTVTDEVGTLASRDVGTTPIPGVIGQARHLAGGQGIFGGDKIGNYPSGGSEHSTEAWFRAQQPNATIIGWGNEGGGRGTKVRMQCRSPLHVHVDSDFADVDAPGKLPMNEWNHVVYTYAGGDARIYVNGQLAGEDKPVLNIKSPARLWLGGWYHNYDFVGDLDEVRISKVARSADCVRLEFENQKPLQTVVGPVVQKGDAFSVSPSRLTVAEGRTATFTARAGGAQKLYWILKKDGVARVVAVDRYSYTLDAGRVTGDTALTLQFKAVLAGATRTAEIPVQIREAIPDPVIALKAPPMWNGRDTIFVQPVVRNLALLKARGAADLNTVWTVSGGAVIKETAPAGLILKRSQYTGRITVQAAVSNGGATTVATTSLVVTEPKQDAWVQRTPDQDEKPVDGQFYARDDTGEGTLHYNGTLAEPAATVFLRVYADAQLYQAQSQKPTAGRGYRFAVRLKPGLVRYRVEFGTKAGDAETVLHTVSNLVCGDAYIITGQSNAVADVQDNPETSDWIRSFGNMGGGNGKGWTNAVRGSASGDLGRIGYWGFDVARELVAKYRVPICIFNGAVGGTRIDQHQPNPADHADPQTIYGRLYARIVAARLTHGIRGLLWYQGENNQGAASPTGDEDWKSYQSYFVDLAAAWKQDYPNIQHYYVFQFWPDACAMGGTHAADMTGEVIRTLPHLFSNLRIMSVLGIVSPGSGRGNCHFAWQGYAQVASLITPVIERDNYGLVPAQAVTAPNLQRAAFTSAARDAIALEFDQPMIWNDATRTLFYLDAAAGAIRSGQAAGNVVTLQLTGPSAARSITYLKGQDWDGKQGNLLYGANKIAALTFCDVPLVRAVAPAESRPTIKDYGLKPYAHVSKDLPHREDAEWKLVCALPYTGIYP